MTRSRDLKTRQRAAFLQRQRRAHLGRIDYMPSAVAAMAIGARGAQEFPGSASATYSAVINSILEEWAARNGFRVPNSNAGASSRSVSPPEFRPSSRARVGAYESEDGSPEFPERSARARMTSVLSSTKKSPPARFARVVCGARRHRDGGSCCALSEPGKRRCRFHGGRSTGPRSAAGKTAALANLRQYRGPKASVSARRPAKGC